MRAKVGLWVALGLCWAMAGQGRGQGPAGNADRGYPRTQQPLPADPDQPVQPQAPRLQRRDVPQEPGQPFAPLDARAQAQLDRVLDLWEQSTGKVKKFSCQFTRWEYDLTRPKRPPQPDDPIENYLAGTDEGEIRFAAPDKGYFHAKGPRQECWICDGKSIYAYNFQAKLITEHRLAPEMQGKAIADGPLPFLFGAKAAQLKSRYFMRLVSSPENAPRNQIWLEAYPRSIDDARNFSSAQAILSGSSSDQMLVMTGLQIVQPGRTKWTAYKFDEIMVNRNGPLDLLRNPFSPWRPGLDWKFVEGEVLGGPAPQQQPPPRPAPTPLGSRRASPR